MNTTQLRILAALLVTTSTNAIWFSTNPKSYIPQHKVPLPPRVERYVPQTMSAKYIHETPIRGHLPAQSGMVGYYDDLLKEMSNHKAAFDTVSDPTIDVAHHAAFKKQDKLAKKAAAKAAKTAKDRADNIALQPIQKAAFKTKVLPTLDEGVSKRAHRVVTRDAAAKGAAFQAKAKKIDAAARLGNEVLPHQKLAKKAAAEAAEEALKREKFNAVLEMVNRVDNEATQAAKDFAARPDWYKVDKPTLGKVRDVLPGDKPITEALSNLGDEAGAEITSELSDNAGIRITSGLADDGATALTSTLGEKTGVEVAEHFADDAAKGGISQLGDDAGKGLFKMTRNKWGILAVGAATAATVAGISIHHAAESKEDRRKFTKEMEKFKEEEQKAQEAAKEGASKADDAETNALTQKEEKLTADNIETEVENEVAAIMKEEAPSDIALADERAKMKLEALKLLLLHRIEHQQRGIQ